MPLASVSSALTTLVGDHGLYAVFGLMALDAVFPAASELVMLYAGALAAGVFASHVSLFGSRIPSGFDAYLAMALAGTIGYLLGAIVGWAIGFYGDRKFRVSERKLAKARRWFDRWEDWAVFVGRVTPVARSFVSIPAGIFRMPFGRYTVLTGVGSAVWCFAFAGAGWGLGRSWERFHRDFRFVDYAVVVAVVLLAGWLVLRWRSRRARLAAE
ncbi:MAG: DedA family protein [Actinobacteria bacterium]|nr:MAG: DedA family protein [Actinomycetota bacterium]